MTPVMDAALSDFLALTTTAAPQPAGAASRADDVVAAVVKRLLDKPMPAVVDDPIKFFCAHTFGGALPSLDTEVVGGDAAKCMEFVIGENASAFFTGCTLINVRDGAAFKTPCTLLVGVDVDSSEPVASKIEAGEASGTVLGLQAWSVTQKMLALPLAVSGRSSHGASLKALHVQLEQQEWKPLSHWAAPMPRGDGAAAAGQSCPQPTQGGAVTEPAPQAAAVGAAGAAGAATCTADTALTAPAAHGSGGSGAGGGDSGACLLYTSPSPRD